MTKNHFHIDNPDDKKKERHSSIACHKLFGINLGKKEGFDWLTNMLSVTNYAL